MRKLSIMVMVCLALVMVFAGEAFAEQAKYTKADGQSGYLPTTVTTIYDIYGTINPTKFTADGTTNYPYEIYLPNEQRPDKYRIHSNYSKNTDACASCHATHTAVGKSLLQWYTVYDTCMACHDGTVTTTYNVEDGKIRNSDQPAFGGMFGTGQEEFVSNHNVTGALEIAAAPGGSSVANDIYIVGQNQEEKYQKTQWASEFGCESCHSPHGQGGNARILNADPNFVKTAEAGTKTYNSNIKPHAMRGRTEQEVP